MAEEKKAKHVNKFAAKSKAARLRVNGEQKSAPKQIGAKDKKED